LRFALLVQACEVCLQPQSPPSVSEPSVTTVAKVEGPEGLPETPDQDYVELKWACKKCTLLNDGSSMACIVCGGSKLRSITQVCNVFLLDQ
jgi:calpain-15